MLAMMYFFLCIGIRNLINDTIDIRMANDNFKFFRIQWEKNAI